MGEVSLCGRPLGDFKNDFKWLCFSFHTIKNLKDFAYGLSLDFIINIHVH